jgi:tether containing UBX domain for GLUT4
MASHVVVIDATARRTQIKTTPGKHLSEVLEEACAKLGINAAQYGLRYVRFSFRGSEEPSF